MRKNQKGFGLIEGLLIIIVLGLIGLAGWFILNKGQIINGGEAYRTEHYALGLSRDADNFSGKYGLTVDFNDSWDPDSACGDVYEDFKASVITSDQRDDSATISITQNKKPYDEKSRQEKSDNKSSELTSCTLQARFPYETSHVFDKAWLENSHPTKTLTIQGKKYTLKLDKDNYKLTLSDGNTTLVSSYIPDGIGAINSYTGCHSLIKLNAFAKEHGLELAQNKYPDLEKKLKDMKATSDHGSDSIFLLVIANDFLVDLLKKAPRGDCQVWVENNWIWINQDPYQITVE